MATLGDARRWPRCAAILFFAALALSVPPIQVHAANFTVNSNDDDGDPGTLRWAIEQLNAAGPGDHSITFNNNINDVLAIDDLPQIDATGMTVVINGRGATLNGHDHHRLIFVVGGNVTLLNFNLKNGLADGGQGGDGNGGGGGGGGLGGALFVNNGANVTLSNVNFRDNSAVGGDGGEAISSLGGSGGGGLGGNGGDATGNGGGGGGGYSSNGGNSHGTGGGGGGGIFGDGGNTSSSGGGGGGGILLPGGPALGPLPGIGALTGGDGGAGVIGGNGGAGFFGGGGGGGEALLGNAGDGGDGGYLGGGGGGGYSDNGGDGGDAGSFGGGGGAGTGSSSSGTSGDGGFGGGGGGASHGGAGGTAGFGAGNGADPTDGGDGGSGYGGAVFVRQGGTLTIINSAISGNAVSAGDGGEGSSGSDGADGAASGEGMYLHTGVTANVQINNGLAYTYADTIGGDGGINKTGAGTLELSANNSYLGDTTVSTGTLVVNGTITSDTTVNNGARLGGSGTIAGEVVNGGTIAPGNSIGTLHIAGDFIANGSSTLEIEVNAGGTTPGVNVDLLDVDDDAQLLGNVDVFAAPGAYTAGSQYTFLTATNRTGTFSGITDDFAFLDAVLGYTATSAFFTLVNNSHDYTEYACTVNTFHVAEYLDEIAPTATGELEDLLQALNGVSEVEACFALEQLTGAIYGSTAQIGVDSTTIYLQALARRLRSNFYDGDGSLADSAAPADADVVYVNYTSTEEDPLVIHDCRTCRRRWNTWTTGYGLGGDAQSDGNAAGLDYTLGGTLVGAETMSGTHLLGLYGGYAYNYVGTDANESSKINGGLTGGYYVGRDDNQYYIAAGGFEFDGYDSRRHINFAGLTANGDTDGWKGYSYFERGATYGSRSLAVQPFGGLQYIYVRQNGFTETGAAAANLAVPGIDANSLRSVLGSRIYATRTSRSGRLVVPELRTLWLHEFLDDKTGFETTFASVGDGGFAINGLGLGRDWAILGGGLNCDLGAGWSTYGDYDLMLNDRTTFHIGSGGVQYLW